MMAVSYTHLPRTPAFPAGADKSSLCTSIPSACAFPSAGSSIRSISILYDTSMNTKRHFFCPVHSLLGILRSCRCCFTPQPAFLRGPSYAPAGRCAAFPTGQEKMCIRDRLCAVHPHQPGCVCRKRQDIQGECALRNHDAKLLNLIESFSFQYKPTAKPCKV